MTDDRPTALDAPDGGRRRAPYGPGHMVGYRYSGAADANRRGAPVAGTSPIYLTDLQKIWLARMLAEAARWDSDSRTAHDILEALNG